jgi:hypothetical protein
MSNKAGLIIILPVMMPGVSPLHGCWGKLLASLDVRTTQG